MTRLRGNGLQTDIIDQQTDRVVVDGSVETSPSSVIVGQNLSISSAGEGFWASDLSDGRKWFMSVYLYDDINWSQRIFRREWGALAWVVRSSWEAENSGTATFTLSLTAEDNYFTNSIRLKANSVSSVNTLVIKKGTREIARAENIDFTDISWGVTEIPINIDLSGNSSWVVIASGNTYNIEVTWVDLKWETTGGQFVPYYEQFRANYVTRTILEDTDIDDNSDAPDKLLSSEKIRELIDDDDWNGWGGTPTTLTFNLFYWLSTSNNPASVDTSWLTEVTEHMRNNILTSTGITTAGQYYIILAPQTHNITRIRDTVLDQDVTSIFTKTTNVRQISWENYNSFVIWPLNAWVNESYNLTVN